MKNFKKAEIIWRDSNRYIDQIPVEDNDCIFETIHTVGYLIEDAPEYIVLSQDRMKEDMRGVIVIPKENIISKKTFK